MSSSKAKPAMKSRDLRRRRHERYRADFRVTVSHLLGDEYQNVEGHCRDLSEAGMGIILAAELQRGDVVNLKFALPGSELRWELRAVVRYCQGCQYGFEFLSLPDESRKLIENHVKNLDPVD